MMLRKMLFIIFNLYATTLCAGTLHFPDACAKGQTLTIAAVGDILLHYPLQVVGLKKGFTSLWEQTLPTFKSADIVYANLEGPIDAGKNVGTGFPLFNYPETLAPALKQSGVTIVSTANNHALDQSAKGIDNTLSQLDKAGVKYVGSRARGSERPWSAIVEKNNFKIAWIACTAHTNGITDTHNQVLYCFKPKDRTTILNLVRDLKNQVDAVIVTPHWGEEYNNFPEKNQQAFAKQLLDAGALAVIGSHPHVLQPMEKYITPDKRTTFIAYSLGNFVSYQGTVNQRTSVILLLDLTKTQQGTVINGMRFVPLFMSNRAGLQQLYVKYLENYAQNPILTRVLPDNVNGITANPTHCSSIQ